MKSIQQKLDELAQDTGHNLDLMHSVLVTHAKEAPPEYDANYAFISGQVQAMKVILDEVISLIQNVNLSKKFPTFNGTDWR